MTVRLSTALVNKLGEGIGIREVFKDAMINIYTGTAPATADLAASGTLLVTITHDAATRGYLGSHDVWTARIGNTLATSAQFGAMKTVMDSATGRYRWTNTPDRGGRDAVGKAFAADMNRQNPKIFSTYVRGSTGARRPGALSATSPTGAYLIMSSRFNTDDFTPSTGATAASGNLWDFDNMYGGAHSTGGLWFDDVALGVLSIPSGETWQGTNVASGTAAYFRLVQLEDATTTADTTYIYPRIQGSVSTSGADMNLTSISLTLGAPTIISTFSITIPMV